MCKFAFGAPDFVAEVISSSSEKKDSQLKYYKYSQAGVREYWLVYPERQKLVVYDFEHEDLPAIYSFGDRVPVGIWKGECVVDFSELAGLIESYFPNDSEK